MGYYSTMQQIQSWFDINDIESTWEVYVVLFIIYCIPTLRRDSDKREEVSLFE